MAIARKIGEKVTKKGAGSTARSGKGSRARMAPRPAKPRPEAPEQEPISDPGNRNGRVLLICEMMGRDPSDPLGFVRGKTLQRLVKDWRLSRGLVAQMCAEASRIMQLVGAKDQLIAFYQRRLAQIATEDGSDRVQACRTGLENLGELRQKHEVRNVRDPFDGWTEEEVREFADTGKRPHRLGGG